MVIRTLALALTVVVIGLGCSSATDKKAKHSGRSDAEATLAASGPAVITNAASVGDATAGAAPVATAEKANGLPAFCKGEAAAGDKFCVICTPRNLPLRVCREVAAGFDAAVACSFDDKELTCKTGKEKDLTMSLEETMEEKFLRNLPLLAGMGKILVDDKLKNKPEEAAMAKSAIEFLEKNAAPILAGTNNAEVADGLLAVLAPHKPDMDDATKEKIRTGTIAALETLNAAKADGTLGPLDATKFFFTIVGLLPAEEAAKLLDKVTPELLATILAGISGDTLPDFGAIAAMLKL